MSNITTITMIFRSLCYHWRLHLLLVLAITVCIAVLIGSLALGDSVGASLRQQQTQRMGSIQHAIVSSGSLFADSFAQRLQDDLQTDVSGVLSMRGFASNPENKTQQPQLMVHGVDANFWKAGLLNHSSTQGEIPQSGVGINRALADALQLRVGDEFIVRIEKPSFLSRDAPLSPSNDQLIKKRVQLAAIIESDQLGDFSLSLNQEQQLNVFMPLATVQTLIEQEGYCNQFFVLSGALSAEQIDQSIKRIWTLEDVGMHWQRVSDVGESGEDSSVSELRSQGIFIPQQITAAIADRAQGIFSYMVNALVHGQAGDQQRTPYSIVAALDPTFAGELGVDSIERGNIIVNTWLAEDLQLLVGDTIDLEYYAVQNDNSLLAQSETFTVSAIVAIEGLAADRSLMPPFPGLSEKDDCRDWDPGTEVDLTKIRPKDEAYWDEYKGTPKAFISMQDGRRLWQNRFGDATAFRIAADQEKELTAFMQNNLNPADFSLRSINIAVLADQAASKGAYYIASVFVSLNGFLIIAVLLLISLCTSLAMSRRRRDVGILLSMGFTVRKIRRMFLVEMLILTIIASVDGILLAYLYNWFLVAILQSAWSDAIAGVQIVAQINISTLCISVIAVMVLVTAITFFHVQRMSCMAVLELLQRPQLPARVKSRSRVWSAMLCLTSLLGATVLLFVDCGVQWMAAQFFIAAGLLLCAGFAASYCFLLSQAQSSSRSFFSLWVMGNLARKPLRSMMLLMMLSSCVFLVVASSAFHMQGDEQLSGRKSASGGFTYFGRSSLAIERNINNAEGRAHYHIDQADLESAHVVMMRSNNDNEGSCLNLNQNANPQVWGLDWTYLDQTNAFSFAQAANSEQPWQALAQRTASGRIPIIGDINYLMWTLGKTVGSVLEYPLDDGSIVEFEVCGLLQDSILQGALIMDEKFFSELFPQRAGYNYMLIDVPADRSAQVIATLQQAFYDQGLTLESSTDRFMRYVRVRNMYLLIFQIMGALGLLLGSLGLSVVVLRHIEERRYEWAVVRAIGYQPQQLMRALIIEHCIVFFAAVSLGFLSAYCAILPVLSLTGHSLSPIVIALLLAVCASGYIAIIYAARMQRSQSLSDALRCE